MKIHQILYTVTAIFALLSIGILWACKDSSFQHPKNLTVLLYSEYIAPDMITDFQMKTGYKLQLELYEALDEMIAKLNDHGDKHYDVIIASDVVIPQLIGLGLVAPIDTNKIPNRVNIAEQFKSPSYDPENTYTLPYLWGTTGILYNDTTIDPNNVSYSMLFDASQTKGKFSLLDESHSMLSMALQAKGFNANSTNPWEINQAADLLLNAKKDPNFSGFDGSVNGKDKILSGENWASIVFNGEAMTAIAANPTLRFAIPNEGSFMWIDAMTLSSGARNIEGAYAFINYILDAKVGAKLAKFINYATPNKAALQIIDENFKTNHGINPTREDLDRMVFLLNPGEKNQFLNDAWNAIKTR